ncbi:MAG: acetyl-CoA carboxylase biotin carboxyl carrier protein [Spirochaetes bacterium]|nr:acetyl-CoA carboxylase biotin carboxyl carrier protein [Spirochaetota bacterium]
MATKTNALLGLDTGLISDYAEFFTKNDITELHLASNGITLTMRKGAPAAAPVTVVTAAPAAVAATAAPAAASAPAASAPAAPAPADDSKYQKITSPIVGTFYRAPSPEAPVFVKEGDNVSEDTVVCIVEAMKMMNELKAGVKGRIHKILLANGQPVTQGMPLFLVDK